MNWFDFIYEILAAIVSGVLFYYFNKMLKGQPKMNMEGYFVLFPSKVYSISAWMVLPLVLIGLVGVFTEPSLKTFLIFTVYGTGFGWAGFYMLSIKKHHRVFYNENEIIIYNHKGTQRTCKWNEITAFKYNGGLDYYKIITPKQSIKFQRNLKGIDAFLKMKAAKGL